MPGVTPDYPGVKEYVFLMHSVDILGTALSIIMCTPIAGGFSG